MRVLDKSVVIIRQIHIVSVCTYKRAIFIGRQDVNGIIYIPLHHMYAKCCPHFSWGGDGNYIVCNTQVNI